MPIPFFLIIEFSEIFITIRLFIVLLPYVIAKACNIVGEILVKTSGTPVTFSTSCQLKRVFTQFIKNWNLCSCVLVLVVDDKNGWWGLIGQIKIGRTRAEETGVEYTVYGEFIKIKIDYLRYKKRPIEFLNQFLFGRLVCILRVLNHTSSFTLWFGSFFSYHLRNFSYETWTKIICFLKISFIVAFSRRNC